jgi:MoxR-like ATPase
VTVADWAGRLKDELGKIIKGQQEVIEHLLIALLARGHVLLEGVPGVAKTLLAKALARCLGAEYRRVQFTPDLMPSDLTGVRVFQVQQGTFELQRGPLFTNLLLADEINRTPPKTQSALLQAMEERMVTIDGSDYALPAPFFVMATQNPVEHEGTYPLPESQLDRFLMKVRVGYPSGEAELEVLRLHHQGLNPHDLAASHLACCSSLQELEQVAAMASAVRLEDRVLAYIVELAAATRRSPQVLLGASPRAAVALLSCAKARAALQGRDYCIPDDVKAVAGPVLRHRLILRPEAELEGLSADRLLAAQLGALPVPR